MMHRRIKNNGLSVLRLLSSPPPQKLGYFVASKPLLLLYSDVVGGGVCSPSAAMPMGGSRRLLFLHAGGGEGEGEGGAAFLVKRDMFLLRTAGKLYSEVPDHLPILCTGRKRLGGGGGGFVPHQSNIRSHMLLLPSFAFARRAFASTSTSQSSSQEPTTTKEEEEEEEEECQTISSSSKLQRPTDDDDEISNSTNVSLNQFPGLLAPTGCLICDTHSEFLSKCATRNLLRLNPVTGYFEEQQDVAAATLQVPYGYLGHVCRGSAYGWLFLTDQNLDMKLFNPFSGAEIQLPPVKNLPPSTLDVEDRWPLNQWFVHKAVFSANPSFEPRPVVLVIYGGQPTTRLAFCKPGDERWTPLEFSPSHTHWDAIYHKGQFYVLSYPGYVATLDIGRLIDDDDHSVKTTLIATPPKRGKKKVRLSYLVMVDGELVKVELRRTCLWDCCTKHCIKAILSERNRDGDTSDEDEDEDEDEEEEDYSNGVDEKEAIEFERYGGSTIDDDDCSDDEKVQLPYPHRYRCPETYGVKIRRLDVKSEKQWVKVESLGGKAVFVGYNTSFALSASDYPAGVCIPDSIYFTYGYGGNNFTERLAYDMGIYNLKVARVKPDGCLRPLYPTPPQQGFVRPAPIWIVKAVI